jgi:DNA adenine methylase
MVRQWLGAQSPKASVLVEPFAGGAAVALMAVSENFVKEAHFAEIDEDVAATWECILNGRAIWLCNQIREFKIGRRAVKAKLKELPTSVHERALQCVIRNRTARGGVLQTGAGLLREGDGQGIASRWYPKTLTERIAIVSALKERLHFHRGNGFHLIKQFADRKDVVFFVDPPYTSAANRLYHHWQVDHVQLFKLLLNVAGSVLMTYDATTEIRKLALKHNFQVRTIPMKTSHHQKKRELMISRDFIWLS